MLSTHPLVQQYGQARLYPVKRASPVRINSFVDKVKDLIRQNFDNELFDVAELARQTHLSVSQLNRKLNKYINQPAGQLIREMKMAYAAHLLVRGENTVGEIAYEVGYRNQANFCRSFKRQFACSPSVFRAKIDR